MNKKILIRYGELSLKGRNRMSFIKQLTRNIKRIYNLVPEVTFDRMFLDYSGNSMKILKNVIGISSFSSVFQVITKYEEIKKAILYMITDYKGTFKIKAKRSWKKFPKNSQQINCEIGNFVIKNSNLTVNIKNPDHLIEIEISKDFAYIFDNRTYGIGGLPTGINGKVLHLLSGGIDSPVAAFELMKRGLHVDFLSFITPPQTDEMTVTKIKKIISILAKYQGEGKLFLANYSILLESLSLMSKQNYRITLMRRSFYRIAQKLAISNKYSTISNGENLGQVASQTLESIIAIQDATNLPVLRPLLTKNKSDTIKIAQKIGTLEISNIHAKETCELFTPNFPVIKPTIEISKKIEEEYPDILELENNLIRNIKTIKINMNHSL